LLNAGEDIISVAECDVVIHNEVLLLR